MPKLLRETMRSLLQLTVEIFADKKVNNISIQRRTSQGVRIIKLDDKDEVISMAKVIEVEEEPLEASNATVIGSEAKNVTEPVSSN